MNHREPEQQVDCAVAQTLWREPHTEGRLTGKLSLTYECIILLAETQRSL
jgi:hypothetical protein